MLVIVLPKKIKCQFTVNTRTTGQYFIQGIVVSVLNPKVALFFLSFLPQFIDPHSENPTWVLLIYGLTFSTMATLCNLAYAVAGSWAFSQAKTTHYTRILEGVSGVMLIGLAGKIALDNK
ncbi:LysE family translocator [Pseudoalteromonas luteoviolacea]|uniref:LysE family translocator n=1 Tax=Pseudoalteromonas luteoviolacea TaxID=43657 RepID=UPI0022866E23|nr:LysE family translocator [Pseudoalteromonas luteoviolacea]